MVGVGWGGHVQFVTFLKSEVTEFDDRLNVGKEVKENASRMTPGFLRAGLEGVRCLYDGAWFWTILSLKSL